MPCRYFTSLTLLFHFFLKISPEKEIFKILSKPILIIFLNFRGQAFAVPKPLSSPRSHGLFSSGV
jgi:hypothetical protein